MITLMHLYHYRIYSWNLYLWKNENMALTNSVMAIVFNEVMIVNMLFQIIEDFSYLKLISPFDNIPIALLSVGILYYLNY